MRSHLSRNHISLCSMSRWLKQGQRHLYDLLIIFAMMFNNNCNVGCASINVAKPRCMHDSRNMSLTLLLVERKYLIGSGTQIAINRHTEKHATRGGTEKKEGQKGKKSLR